MRKSRIIFLAALSTMGCGSNASSTPNFIVAIPDSAQSALGYQSLFLSSDGKLYVTPAGAASTTNATYDVQLGAPPGATASLTPESDPVAAAAIEAAMVYSILGSPQNMIDLVDFLLDANATTGIANITSNKTQSPPLSVSATVSTTAASAPVAAAPIDHVDHSDCFGAAYEGVANAQKFCDCYYGVGSSAAADCLLPTVELLGVQRQHRFRREFRHDLLPEQHFRALQLSYGLARWRVRRCCATDDNEWPHARNST